MTGAEREITAQPPAGPAEPQEGQQAREEAGMPARKTAESGRERAKPVFASFLMLFVELA